MKLIVYQDTIFYVTPYVFFLVSSAGHLIDFTKADIISRWLNNKGFKL